MQKASISIQILGSNSVKLSKYQSQISALINKEVTTYLFDNSAHERVFEHNSLPDVLIFLLDDTTVGALNQLTALSVRTILLVIAGNDNHQQMRLAMQAGARDFFTDPVDSQELYKSLSRIIFDVHREQSKKGGVTAIVNAKGGSGASFIACNLAHMTSSLSDANVVLVDFDLQYGSQALNLDINPINSIVDALNDISKLDFDAINGYMTLHKSGLRLLSTHSEQIVLPGEVKAENAGQLLTLLISYYDQVFLDIPPQIDALFAILIERSDKVIIVIQLTLAHIRNANRLINILKSEFNFIAKNIHVVVNRYDGRGSSSLDLSQIESALQSGTIYTIANDFNNAIQSSNLGSPIYDYAKNSPIVPALQQLLKVVNISIKEKPKKWSFKALFSGKDH